MANPEKHRPKKRGGDQSFDDRAVHLNRNIYGSDKGQLRLKILQRDLLPYIKKSKSLSILDAGCGLGYMTKWALDYGHDVTACDSSAVMIDETKKRADTSKITTIESSVQNLPNTKKYDIIFCHAVVEWVENQQELIEKLSDLLVPGGHLSLMFYNAWAREMAQMVYGNFAYIDRNYAVHQRVKLSPHYPASPDEIENQLSANGLSIACRSGIRIFYDIMREREHYKTHAEDIMRHELRVSQQHPYWQMGRYIHIVATKENTI